MVSLRNTVIIAILSLIIGGAIAYKCFPQTIRETKIVEKDKLVIKDGKLSVIDGKFHLLPDGSFEVAGKFSFDFGSYNSASSSVSQASTKGNINSYLWLTANIANPTREFGVSYDTPFLFNTKIRVDVTQIDFKELKVMGAVGIPFQLF